MLGDRGDGGVDVLGLGDDLDAVTRSSSARTPVRNMAWSSTRTTCSVLMREPPDSVSSGSCIRDLGALARRAADGDGAAVPLHPSHDRTTEAEPVLGHLIGVESDAPVAHEHLGRAAVALGVDVDASDLCVLRGVDHGLAGRPGERRDVGVERGVTDADDLHRDVMGLLDLRGSGSQRGEQRVAVLVLVAVQPGPQVALLPPGQRGDGRGVVGVLLQQRERLQHRVVQVGRDVGALLRADALAALGGQVAEQLADPRAEDEGDADQGDAGGRGDVDEAAESALLGEHVDAGEQPPSPHRRRCGPRTPSRTSAASSAARRRRRAGAR